MFSYTFFSRHGGVSQGLYNSLNVSYHVGDEVGRVRENRRRVKAHFGSHYLICARQVHGDKVYAVKDRPLDDLEVEGYDALVTGRRDVALFIQQADCQAVLLHDPARQVIAAIHCGWRGSVANIIGKTVAVMEQQYSSNPDDIKAYMGPSLGPCCAEFINFSTELPESFLAFQAKPAFFDFWRISADQLIRAGLREASISRPKICTSCSPDYFSYRRACRDHGGITGRHGSGIRL